MSGRGASFEDLHPDLAERPMISGPSTGGPEIDLPGEGPRPRPSPSPSRLAELERSVRRPRFGSEGEDRRRALREWLDDAVVEQVRWCAEGERRTSTAVEPRRELPSDLDPHRLDQAGWGVVWPQRVRPGLRAALAPLLERRRREAGRRYREITYRTGDSPRRFLEDRLRQPPGVIDPDRAPYYLLIAGGPEEIPFEIQYRLDLGHASGRLSFERLEDCRRYARAVVAAEDGRSTAPRRLTLFSVQRRGDLATDRLARHLVAPLADRLGGGVAGWQVETWGPDRAHRRDLARLLGGGATPGVLLAACHGLSAVLGDTEQESLQGALLCQDWPPGEPVARDHCFAAADLAAAARLDGLIAVLLACHGAGTPVEDSYPARGGGEGATARALLAARPFIARLPQALLAHGALAVLGHVDRGFTTSFSWLLDGDVEQASGSLEDVLRRLMSGERTGHALRPLRRRFATLAAELAPAVEAALEGADVDPDELRALRVAVNDARNFILLGDPAVYATGRRIDA